MIQEPIQSTDSNNNHKNKYKFEILTYQTARSEGLLLRFPVSQQYVDLPTKKDQKMRNQSCRDNRQHTAQ